MLSRLGLDRPELRAWAMYDWANSAYQVTIVAAVFPIYYAQIASADVAPDVATSRYAFTKALAILVIAVLAPILGALADARPLKKRFLALFVWIGVISTAAMAFIGPGDWPLALTLVVVSNIAVAGSLVFSDSLLPFVARPDELDRVSTTGYALGYVGGGLLLAVNLLMIQQPGWFGLADAAAGTRAAFVSVAIWWLVFSRPILRRVPEPPVARAAAKQSAHAALADAFRQLGNTFRELRRFKQALLLLVAFFLYNDGVQTMIAMAAIYGQQIGIGQTDLIAALLITQFVGVPFAFLFGAVAGRIGARASLFIALSVYVCISLLAYWMTSAWQFYTLAIMVGTVQGGTQALSRSLFASMIPRQRSSEFFAFFGVFERYAAVLGPAIFGWAAAAGSGRLAVLALVPFFVVGMVLLAFVKVKDGQAAARAAEGRT